MSSPAPQIQVRRVRPRLDEQQHEIQREAGLSEFLSAEIFTFLTKIATNLFAKQQYILTNKDVLLEILSDPSLGIILKLDSKKIPEFQAAANKLPPINASKVTTTGSVVIAPEVKAALMNALPFAKRAQSGEIMLEHFWQALQLQPELSSVFGSVSTLNETTTAAEPGIEPEKPIQSSALPVTLAAFANNLSQTFKADNKRPIIGREKELNQILRSITREEKNNLLLIGENGVGKASIVNGLAFELIYNDKLPTSLKQLEIISLDFTALVAGTDMSGNNLPEIVNEIKSLGHVIVFLENLHYDPLSQDQYLLMTLLSLMIRSQVIQVLISTDPIFARSVLEKEPFFNEHFDIIKVDEPPEEVTKKIIFSEAEGIAKKNTVQFATDVFDLLFTLTKRYLASQSYPQKAISLLEEAATMVKLNGSNVVTIDSIKQILSEKTGIPINSISVAERQQLMDLDDALNKVVIGQPHAVKAVSEAIQRSRAGLKDQKKPVGSFLFLGPSGVGKTELAKQLATLYYNDEKAFVRLDMSEYSEQHTSQRLIGSPPGYTGYEEGGQLTNPIIAKPYSLILLDEIEKAHPKIFDIFLQVLDEGRLTDSRGKLADFRNAILIFTSNIGADMIFSDLTGASSQFVADPRKFYEENLLPELLKFFRPEFINRFDEVIPFRPLGLEELVSIARIKLARVAGNLKEKQISLVVPDAELVKLVQSSYDPRFGARPIERMIKMKIENPIAEGIINGQYAAGAAINWTFS